MLENHRRNFLKFLFFYGLLLSTNLYTVSAQGTLDLPPILEQMGDLESARDAKCHATASRLEDFVFGTPLSFEARDKRINFQQDLVEKIWLDYTKLSKKLPDEPNSLALFEQATAQYLSFTEQETGILVSFKNGKKISIAARDYRQYSSVAYAFRAILSVQQAYLFKPETLAPLSEDQNSIFKKVIDLAVLAVLHEADHVARTNNDTSIELSSIEQAIDSLFFINLEKDKNEAPTIIQSPQEQVDLVHQIIQQKLAAYQAYNQINQAIFLRNIQVYFTKVLWPSDPKLSDGLKNYYTEAMIQFSTSILDYAQSLALKQNKTKIAYKEVYQAVQAFLPHEVNAFEDVIYFPNFSRADQISIEAYDLDAFRDSGLHWQYLKFALDDYATQVQIVPDPYALEMMVEGIAQFAVLIFRMGGENAKANGQNTLTNSHINQALINFQKALDKHPTHTKSTNESKIISSATKNSAKTHQQFQEVSKEWGLSFEHRNSDWLSRLIRSYVIKSDENLARMSIPPAFGGGGVATEDIDNDGWVDVLLLGGRGNQLLKNNQGKGFIDITHSAGLEWKRPDSNHGEPRQPIIADFDNDGWQDIFIAYANDMHRIYRNKGDGTFEDMTTSALLGGEGLVGGPCTALDYDKDGLLDLYIGYFGNYLEGELPTLKRHNTNGSPNKLFRNTGNFTFQDVSEHSGIENRGWTQAAGHADINKDGWQDLIVGNDFGVNAYYINNQDGTFTDKSIEMGTDKPSYTMNVGIADLNRDLRPDFYISNIVVMEKDDKYVLPNEDTPAHFDPASLSTMRVIEANDLFISSIDKEGQTVFQKSKAVGRGHASTGWSWDADFFDFDNDMDEDLYCLTGMNQYSVYGAENAYYSSPEGESKSVQYAESNAESNIFFENKNGFLEVAEANSGLNYSGTSRSAAYFDMDNDGDLDIIVNEYQGAAKLFKNPSEQLGNHWVNIKLVGNPRAKTTKDAVGTTLVLTTPSGEQLWQEVHSTTGYLSGHPKMLHFGLGEHTTFDLKIEWPDGTIQEEKQVSVDRIHQFVKK